MCTVNYSGRNVRFKVPRLDKKMCRRYSLLRKKNLGKHTAYQETTFLYIKDAAVKRSQSHSKVNCKYLHPIMNEALRRSLGNYYNIALLIGQ